MNKDRFNNPWEPKTYEFKRKKAPAVRYRYDEDEIKEIHRRKREKDLLRKRQRNFK